MRNKQIRVLLGALFIIIFGYILIDPGETIQNGVNNYQYVKSINSFNRGDIIYKDGKDGLDGSLIKK